MSKSDKVKFLLENYGQNDQRTAAWHAKRGQMLTASEIYKGLPDATPLQRHELIMSKLVPRQQGNQAPVRALIWGTYFEPIAKQIYCELQHNIQIADTTCVPHPTVSFLGASPDGIIISNDDRHGKLVEFKCPISRKFTENTPIPDGYYHQMQLQMECTGLDECEYIEMAFEKLNFTEWTRSKAPCKSIFAVHSDGTIKYRDMHDTTEPHEWKLSLGDNWEEYEIIYWELQNWRATTVKKQKGWLDLCLPSLTKIWSEIEEYRKTGTFPPDPREKGTLVI